jgi:hypothetical protein
VNWSNGNTSDYPYTVYDWFLLTGTPGPNSGVAIAGLDRAIRRTGVPDNNMTNPALFYYDIDLSADPNYLAGALIESVTAMRQPGNDGVDITNLMGLSGATSVPEPSALLLTISAGAVAIIGRRRPAQWRALSDNNAGGIAKSIARGGHLIASRTRKKSPNSSLI